MRKHPPIWLQILVSIIALPLVLPFAYIILRSFDVGWQRAFELVFRQRVWMLMENTLILMIVVTAISMVIGTMSAFILERYKIFGKPFFRVTVTLPLCVPAFVASFSWLSLSFYMSGLPGSVIVMTFASIPLAFLPVAAALQRVDKSLEEISLSLGKSHLYTFYHAVLPQLKPALGSSLLLIALHILIEFGAVSILNYQTFTTAIFLEYNMSFDNASAALLSLILVVICLVVVGLELIFRGQNDLSRIGKGVARNTSKRKLRWYLQIPAIFFFLIQFILGIGVPLFMVGYWLYKGTSFHTRFSWMQFLKSLGLSLSISAGGALATVIASMPLVWCAIRYRNRLTVWIERLPFILHAVPGIVIALSLTYFSIHYAYPIYQTFVPVLLAYFMLYMPLAQTALRGSLELVPKEVENVGESLGRSKFFVFRTLLMPAILPGIMAAFALVFLNLMKELTATLVLTPTQVQTMAVSVWQFSNDGAFAAVAPYAIALILFSGIPVYIISRYGFK